MSNDDSNDFSFLYDDLSNDSIFEGMENNGGSQLEGRVNVGLTEPFFDLGDAAAAAEFNAYRKNYRSFRKGRAKGAKGEVTKFKGKSGRGSSVVPPFLEKLYKMLSEDSLGDYIAWSDDGTSVMVKQVTEFSKLVLPRFFKHDKFASFLRQLNMYNFYTIHQEPNMRQFSNPLFRREAKDDIKNIKRKRGTSKKMLVLPGNEKNSNSSNKNIAKKSNDTLSNNTKSISQGKNAKRQKVVNKDQAKTTTNKQNNMNTKQLRTSIFSNSNRNASNGYPNKTKLKLQDRKPANHSVNPISFSPNMLNGKHKDATNGGDTTSTKDYTNNYGGEYKGDEKFKKISEHDIMQMKQTVASTAKANKTLFEEMAILRKEISSNRNQIKAQKNYIKSLEGNLKSITAMYSTMHQSLNLLQQELRELGRGRGRTMSGMSDDFEVPDDD